jgi:hypothetical protein
VKIQEISETLDVGDTVGQVRQFIMSEIEHPKPLQATDLLGHFG